MAAGRICQRQVDLAEAEESVQVAAQRMRQRMVGTLVIVNQDKEPIGILTDRDLVIRVLAEGKDTGETRVGEVMTAPVRTVFEHTPIEIALSTMRSGAMRRLPVVNKDGKLVGILSLDDIMLFLAEEQAQIGSLLEEESPRAYRKI
ncbi:MAG: CBS domain-containing protein [Planctomycetes bacterium]|nr:CBS domain-containing protein [Planctomycetota bacterium]